MQFNNCEPIGYALLKMNFDWISGTWIGKNMEISDTNLTKCSIPEGSILLNDTMICMDKIDCIEKREYLNVSGKKEMESTVANVLPESSCKFSKLQSNTYIELNLFGQRD